MALSRVQLSVLGLGVVVLLAMQNINTRAEAQAAASNAVSALENAGGAGFRGWREARSSSTSGPAGITPHRRDGPKPEVAGRVASAARSVVSGNRPTLRGFGGAYSAAGAGAEARPGQPLHVLGAAAAHVQFSPGAIDPVSSRHGGFFLSASPLSLALSNVN
jgi:hypothetical protein